MIKIVEAIQEHFPDLNDAQLGAITQTDGPLLVIAGPGTGKTLVLVLRTLYLLLSGKAVPSEIIVTTFTEKAAFELRDRISQIARKLGYKGQLHELEIGTIHSICSDFIDKYIQHTPLKSNYVILDELIQYLFLYENFNEIVGEPSNSKFLNRWSTKWTTIKRLISYLNKITEELVDIGRLSLSSDSFIKQLTAVYLRYQKSMYNSNKVDFAHLQKIFLDLLNNPALCGKIKGRIKYIMVDEYQDTNYIQEQIILTLGKPDYNVCVVGDEDQALYRFRGATVRNILEFKTHFDYCKEVKLTINYRSHESIISSYNKFMASIDWANPSGRTPFRFSKEILPNSKINFPDYPAVFCIWGENENDEGERFARMVKFLKKNRIIQDYSQIALLLSSVRLNSSKHYLDALTNYGIPYFAPRAKAYFENEEVKLTLACYAVIFGFHDELKNSATNKLKKFIEDALLLLKDYVDSPLSSYLRRKFEQVSNLKERESLDLTVIDYFYQLLAYKPFCDFLKEENKARNLAIFSKLLNAFQIYYHISLVTFKNKDLIKFYLFNSFFNFLMQGGIDEYEDPENPIPKGYVQVMTIHQSKGLEFPVVVVGSLNKTFKVEKQVDRDLSSFYPRGTFEPEKRVTEFDRTRHFYVSFSRAEKILVLTTPTKPKTYFSPIWDSLNQWPYVEKKTLKALKFTSKPQFIPKKSYSLTSHINVYETCPKQYLFYREYQFTPSRAGTILFGSLVHQTTEDIHRWSLEGNLKEIDIPQIEQWFEENYRALLTSGMRPLGKTQKEVALKQVLNYFQQNYNYLNRIIEAEVDVSVEKDEYILAGKIDLLLGEDEKLEVLDFKTQPKPDVNNPIIDRYYKQLCLYGYILEERYNKNPERLFIYWTSEERRKN
ncbi:MAG: ATP-dependent DNA helicase, partial [Candidatus Aerophobetes bacterium]|nr:ATP-dependent DNA helicase [Candidatus Aerophobetes bacterium]